MTSQDLEHIFIKQINEGTTKYYYMVQDGRHCEIQRHEGELKELLPFLDNFVYDSEKSKLTGMPRFVKQ